MSDSLLKSAENTILFTTKRPPLVMEKGRGMYLWDTSGKKYLDFIGGWAVNCLGHCPEVISDTLCRQSQLLVNASPAFYNPPMLEFAQYLTAHSCFDRVFFGSSGAEANESAIKLARKYGRLKKNGAFEIIATDRSFHGRTLATMAATGKPQWAGLFEPKPKGFVHVPFNRLDAIEAAITPNTCAVILEPIQGEGGVYVADSAYVQGLRKLCDREGILLIFDEIQTGIGRAGTLFAYEQYGIEPDIMTLGKGIGGGFPLSAMLAKEALNLFEPGDQGGTYTAQPLAMAVGLAVVRTVVDSKLWDHVVQMGGIIQSKLAALQHRFPIHSIRGKGLLLAFDLTGVSATDLAARCLEAGLIINASGPQTIRLIPPYILQESHVDEMIRILESAFS